MKYLLLVLTYQAVWAHVREKGVINQYEAMGLRAWYPAWNMKTLDYPQPAPHTMVQTWRYIAFNEDSQQDSRPKAVKVQCNRFYIPKMEGRNDCGEFTMKLEDGGRVTNYCGDTPFFRMISKSDDITFTLTTGPRGGALVDCSVFSIYLDQSGREITTTTTVRTTVRPTKPSYLFEETREIDSSEDGGAPGRRRTSCQCGWSNKAVSRIVNGTETRPNEFPFAAGLIDSRTKFRFCGATIITTIHALTAAHCTAGHSAQTLALLVGEHDITDAISGPTEIIPIERVIDHEQYKTKSGRHDITLLVLTREIRLSQFVGPACLPTRPINLERQYIKIIGWGANVFQGAQSRVLKKVNVRVVPLKECNYMYGDMVSLRTPNMICTYRRKRASCQGDSGGPVVWLDPETNRYTHVGIVSFGRICGDESPSVHTEVAAYLDWIQHHIRATKPRNICTKV